MTGLGHLTDIEHLLSRQREMIKAKPLVKRCYDIWYRKLLADMASVPSEFDGASSIELGSGGGYIKEHAPRVITSDLTPGTSDLVIDAQRLPFANESLKAIFLTHVFHHIPDVDRFLEEAARALVPGGVISMVECAHTPFARLFFSVFHPEPYDTAAVDWKFTQNHSMLDSNQALSWIVFSRDIENFRIRHPRLKFENSSLLPWLSYLVSGGVNLKSLCPAWLSPSLSALDEILKPFDPLFAIHWHITIRKIPR